MISLDGINRLLLPLRNRIMLMIARAVLKKANDDGGLQTTQLAVLAGELRDGVERVQNYGFTSNPHPGAEGVVAFVAGNRDHGLVIAMDDRRYRVKGLQSGEVAIYTDEGDEIRLERNRTINVKTLHLNIKADEDCTITTKAAALECQTFEVTAGAALNIKAGITEILTGGLTAANLEGGAIDAELRGRLKADDVLAGNVSLKGHTHSNVQPGSGTSGPPVGGG